MKCVIFLLALCAFETAFAVDFEVELFRLHERAIYDMERIVALFYPMARAKIQSAQRRNVQVTLCMREYHELQRYHEDRITKCNECYTSALGHRKIEVAQQCHLYNIAALTKEANSRRRTLDICIKNILVGHPYLPRPAAVTEAGLSTSNQSRTG